MGWGYHGPHIQRVSAASPVVVTLPALHNASNIPRRTATTTPMSLQILWNASLSRGKEYPSCRGRQSRQRTCVKRVWGLPRLQQELRSRSDPLQDWQCELPALEAEEPFELPPSASLIKPFMFHNHIRH